MIILIHINHVRIKWNLFHVWVNHAKCDESSSIDFSFCVHNYIQNYVKYVLWSYYFYCGALNLILWHCYYKMHFWPTKRFGIIFRHHVCDYFWLSMKKTPPAWQTTACIGLNYSFIISNFSKINDFLGLTIYRLY